MVIKGEIQRVDKKTFRDKQTGQDVTMFTVLVGDRTKQFRCTTPLSLNLSEDRFRQKFGNVRHSQLVDEPVTLAIVEMTAKNAFISIRGEIVQGHHTAEAFADLMEGVEASAEKPAASTTSAPAASTRPSRAAA